MLRLTPALALMTNLTHLTLAAPNLKLDDLVHGHYSFKLARFGFSGIVFPDNDDSFTNFFIAQSSITNLQVHIYTRTNPVPSKFLPNLQVMRGPLSPDDHVALTKKRLDWGSVGPYFGTLSWNGCGYSSFE